MTTQQFESEVLSQCKLSTGINEVFMNQNDIADYIGINWAPSKMMQKIFAVVVNGELYEICLKESQAWNSLNECVEL